MPDDLTNASDEQRTRVARQIEPKREPEMQPSLETRGGHSTPEPAGPTSDRGDIETVTEHPVSLLDDSRLDRRGNSPARIALMTEMQQAYGNRAVQRFLQRGPRGSGAGAITVAQTMPGSISSPRLSVQRQWPDSEPSGATSSRVQPPTGGSWNAGTVKIGSIRRIPVAGLTLGNQRNDEEDVAAWAQAKLRRRSVPCQVYNNSKEGL